MSEFGDHAVALLVMVRRVMVRLVMVWVVMVRPGLTFVMTASPGPTTAISGTPWRPGMTAEDSACTNWKILSLPPRPYATARCAGSRMVHSASTSASIIASVCSGPGVRRSRSSPRGTVG
jgi:hypothetical protein